MKTLLFYSLLLSAALFMGSCRPTTGSDMYDAVWSPSGNSTYTQWTVSPASGGTLTQKASGFQFAVAALADTAVMQLTFTVTPYVITNITSARDANLSFTARVLIDSVRVVDSSWVQYQFGTLSGTVVARGADSASWSSAKPFVQDLANVITLSVNPDSCSSKIIFNVTLRGRAFSGATPLNPVPRSKPVTFELTGITLRANGVSVLK